MAISPHDIRARQFTTVKRGGYDQREVEAFRTAAAEALEQATQEATAMEARARAAVARLQELQQQAPAAPVEAAAPSDAMPGAVAPDEAETISRTLLLAQRTADAAVADAEREANQIIETAKADSRKAGEAERVRVEGEVQALLAKRDFLESDVDQLDQFLAAQRDRISAVAADLNDVTTRVGKGLGPMRRPQLSAADSDHSSVDEPDVAELIEQVGSAGPGDENP
jgi:cell division initiation protein